MESVKTSVQVPCSISGRYAHRFVYAIQSLSSSIFITHGGRTVNAKSLLGVLSLQLKEKDVVDISCYGENENQIASDTQRVGEILTTINKEDN